MQHDINDIGKLSTTSEKFASSASKLPVGQKYHLIKSHFVPPWKISVNTANQITLNFTDFDLENSSRCEFAYVQVCCFLFYYFIQLCDSRKIHYLTRDFALNCTWKPISHSSLRDLCDFGFRVQFNAECPRQVNEFSYSSGASAREARQRSTMGKKRERSEGKHATNPSEGNSCDARRSVWFWFFAWLA